MNRLYTYYTRNFFLFQTVYTVILLLAFCVITPRFINYQCSPGDIFITNSLPNSLMDKEMSTSYRITPSFSGRKIREAPNIPDSSEGTFVRWDGGPFCDKWAVVTTIFDPSDSVRAVAKNKNWCLVIVADWKTVSEDSYITKLRLVDKTRVIFLSPAKQKELYPILCAATPWNTFQRKNLGYMYAIHHGAQFVWDFDDDNNGLVDLEILEKKSRYSAPCHKFDSPLFNPYPYYGVNESYTWPRGLPLQSITNRSLTPALCTIDSKKNTRVGILQSLANIQPDVDAVYRLTRDTPFNFQTPMNANKYVLVPLNSYCPFNGQATLWTSLTLELLALPGTVHTRVTDIWRSYFAEHIMYKDGIQVLFSPPYVDQYRNPHDYMVDFNDEMDIYEKSKKLIDYLWDKPPSNNIESLYTELYERAYIDFADLVFIRAWSRTFKIAKMESEARASKRAK